MKVKLELLLTRTVTFQVDDSDLDDLSHLVKRIQSPHEENIHAVKIFEVNDRPTGTKQSLMLPLQGCATSSEPDPLCS
jgi:hypothetical protein